MATKPTELKRGIAVDGLDWLSSQDLAQLVASKGADAAEGARVRKYGSGYAEVVKDDDGGSRRIKFVISTSDVDRDNDVIDQSGWDLRNYMDNPVVLWAHDMKQLPVAKCVSLMVEGGRLVAVAEFATHAFAETVYQLYKGGFMRATSVGFSARKWVHNEERGGIDFKEMELLEFSAVPVPANARALVAASAAGLDLGSVRKWVDGLAAAWPGGMKVLYGSERPAPAKALAPLEAPPESARWNRSLSKAFDVAAQEFAPRSAEQAAMARYCEVGVKALHFTEEPVYSTRMGSFLAAADDVLAETLVDDVRNLRADGTEEPPLYETMQLNSTRSQEFLVDGLRFFRWRGVRLGLRVTPRWYGLDVNTYAAHEQREVGHALLGAIKARAKELNFLKGEAFSLSGEFLTRTGAKLEDLILDEKNAKAIKRLAELVERHGAEMESRGALLVGPPGTGKTLSARVLMEAPATFIWCSARDFYYGGGFSAVAEAFSIARECAPSILVLEDVDNYLSGHVTDLMKTEMDGVAQHKGVLTILTSNYPELLPKALIDRPGRFHDVLRFGLPAEAEREKMLRRWLPDLGDDEVARAVTETAGYSGAHVRELARFAGILADQEQVGAGEALTLALAKLAEQRDLITSVQAHGSHYRAPAHVQPKDYEQVITRTADVARATIAKGAAKDEAAACETCGGTGLMPNTGEPCTACAGQAAAEPAETKARSGSIEPAIRLVEHAVGAAAQATRLAQEALGALTLAAGEDALEISDEPAPAQAAAPEPAQAQADETAGLELSGDEDGSELGLSLADDDGDEDGMPAPEELRALLSEVVTAAARDMVRQSAEKAIRELRGRLD